MLSKVKKKITKKKKNLFCYTNIFIHFLFLSGIQYTMRLSKCCSVLGTEHGILKDNYRQIVFLKNYGQKVTARKFVIPPDMQSHKFDIVNK